MRIFLQEQRIGPENQVLGKESSWRPVPGVLYGYLTDWTGYNVKFELEYFEKAI